jgi:hypothetical protein
LEQKRPALLPSAPADLQPYFGLAALFQPQPRPLTVIPVTRPSSAGQFLVGLQTTAHWETDTNKQLDKPYLSPETEVVAQLVRATVEWIAEHPLETIGLTACAALLLYATRSRN